MALNDAYVTTGELRAQTNINDTTDDAELAVVALAVSRNIERYCGRQFNDAGNATARTYAPISSDMLRVDDFSTTTGLVVKSDTALDSSWALTHTSTYYDVWPLNGVVDGQTGHPYREITLHTGTLFITNGRPTVQVTARWGWTAVPSDVKHAALIQSARIFGRKYSHNGVIGFGDFVVRVSSKLDPDVEELLKHYRMSVAVA